MTEASQIPVMPPSPETSAAERLCAACGMCCNGILFHGMRLQPGDPVRTLTRLGLKLKRKDGALLFLQPCNAHRDDRCSIYKDRPERCRIFSCRQLRALDRGEITGENARARINEARRLSDRIRELFSLLGEERTTRDFATRYAGIFTPPLDPSPEAASLRGELEAVMQELETILARHFRTDPT